LTGSAGSLFAAGGSFANRVLTYDGRGNRASESTEDAFHSYTTGQPAVDRLDNWRVSNSGKALSFSYYYDAMGVVTDILSASDSSGSATQTVHFTDGASSTNGTSDNGYSSVNVNGGGYVYYYDGWLHRRLKMYPAGDSDEYFYSRSSLIYDQGNLAQTYNSGEAHYHPVDDYVWLGGRPVVIVHGSQDVTYAQLPDNGNTCSRERDGSACGTYFPITDHIGKPVVMLDSLARIAGVGEYDPSGNVNRVNFDRETGHNVTYSTAGTYGLGSFTQPLNGGLLVDARVHLVGFDPNCAGNGNSVVASAQFTTPGYSWTWGSCHLGNYWFPWLPTSNGTGSVAVVDNTPTTMWGAIFDQYEYRRHQSGAAAFGTPLRFPGQYHDEESDLSQNWNRFYDPLTSRYLQPEPLWQAPVAPLMAAYRGVQAPVYGYANNNPVNVVDPSGLWGAGIVLGGQVEGGVVGGAGLSGQFSPLGVYFNNPKTTDPNGPNFWNGFGFFSSWGGFAGGTSKGPGRVCSTENGDRTGVVPTEYSGRAS
jgi:RHS repeat-associated protein